MTSVQIEMPDEISSDFYRRAPCAERRVELVERISPPTMQRNQTSPVRAERDSGSAISVPAEEADRPAGIHRTS